MTTERPFADPVSDLLDSGLLVPDPSVSAPSAPAQPDPAPEPSLALPEGLAQGALGKYHLIAELGHGGMADVYLAITRGPAEFHFNKLFAVKQLRPHLAEDPDFVALFLEEARLAARLNHPNIVQTNDVGREGNRLFLVMEYLSGQPLSRILSRAPGGLPLRLLLRVLSDALAGLHYAHELTDFDGTPFQIVHRDISPQNVFVGYSGNVKIVDFGVAKTRGGSINTRSGTLKGKLTFMAPEQVRGEQVDRRTDIFAVGVMLWEALTGQRLWKGLSDLDIMRRLVDGGIPRVLDVRPDAPAALARMCNDALAPVRGDRYSTALEFRASIDAFLDATGGRVASSEVGDFVAEHFKEERARIRACVDKQIATAAAGKPLTGELPKLSSPSGSLLPQASNSLAPPAPTPSVPVPNTGTVPVTSAAVSVEEAKPRKSQGVAAAVALLATIALATVVVLRTRAQVSDVAPGAAPSGVDSAPAGSASSHLVEVTVRAEPAEAAIFVDGLRLASNPGSRWLPGDGKTHLVQVDAPGYASKRQIVDVHTDTEVVLRLDRAGQETGPEASAVAVSASAPPHTNTASPGMPSSAPPATSAPRTGPAPARTIDSQDPWTQ